MNFQNNIKQYNVDFFYNQRHLYNKKLPVGVIKILNMNTKINMKVDEKKLKIFDKKTKIFNKSDLEKKINSNLNKLAAENIENIYAIVNAILKERKDILLDYTIKNLLNKAINQPLFCDIYAKFYKKFYNEETQQLFIKIFNDLIKLLDNELNYSDDKNYDSFCKYMKDKSRFNGLFNFISSLYREKIVSRKQINFYIEYLINKIEKETKKDDIEKYYETVCKFLLNVKDKDLIQKNLKKLMDLKNDSKNGLGMKYKFMCLDLKDLLK